MRPEDLLRPSPRGLYCPVGEFYIDPTRAVDRAVITHGHSDHARAGHGHVLATEPKQHGARGRAGGGTRGSKKELQVDAPLELVQLGVTKKESSKAQLLARWTERMETLSMRAASAWDTNPPFGVFFFGRPLLRLAMRAATMARWLASRFRRLLVLMMKPTGSSPCAMARLLMTDRWWATHESLGECPSGNQQSAGQ